jgi:hypothetical protein
MPPITTSWNRPLARVREDRGSLRTALPAGTGTAHRLTGVDGYCSAGLRPVPGFRKVHSLAGADDSSPTVTALTVIQAANGTISSTDRILPNDFWCVTVPVNGELYFSGYVFRVTHTGGNASIWLKYYDSTASEWYNKQIWGSASGQSDAMTVQVVGRLCYVLLKGKEPRAFYFDDASTYDFNLITDTGPGPNPRLEFIGRQYWQDNYDGRITNDAGDTLNEAFGKIAIVGPNGFPLLTNYAYRDYADFVAPNNYNADDPPVVTDAGVVPYPHVPGDYAFAYEFVNTKTGRRSQLSEIAYVSATDFLWAITQAADTTIPTFTQTNVNLEKRSWILFEVLVNVTEYDEVRLYRSIRNQPYSKAGPLQATLFRTETLTSAGNKLDPGGINDGQNNVAANFERWVVWLRLDDLATLNQEVYYNRTVCDEEMPKAGAGTYYNGTLIVSNIGGTEVSDDEPNRRGVGEIRYSSTLLGAPEMFPPANRVVPRSYLDSPIDWVQTAGNVIGLSPEGLHFGRVVGGFINFEAIAEGYGTVSRRAADSIGGLLFYLSETGLKVATTNGALDGTRMFDEVIRTDWASTLDNTFVIYDPSIKVLFVGNPDREEALLTWMETSTTTSLDDFAFVGGDSGVVPGAASTRNVAQFVTEVGDVYVYDRLREKTDGSGNARRAMLDFTGQGRGVIASGSSGVVDTLTVTITGLPVDTSLIGAYVYVSTGTLRGTKFKVTGVVNNGDGTYTFAVEDPNSLVESADLVGATLEISPVFVRWVDAPIGLSLDQQMFGPQDFFRVRAISSGAVYFTDVSGVGASTDSATYTATVWVDNGTEPFGTGEPVDVDGEPVRAIRTGNPVHGIRYPDGLTLDASVIAPGLDVFCTDCDFIALSARIDGKFHHSSLVSGGAQ